MKKRFTKMDYMLEYMTKNDYPQNIINNVILIANKRKNKPNNIKYIILYDDMFEIYYNENNPLKSETYYMDLML